MEGARFNRYCKGCGAFVLDSDFCSNECALAWADKQNYEEVNNEYMDSVVTQQFIHSLWKGADKNV